MVFNEQPMDAGGAREVFDAYRASKRVARCWTLTFTPSKGHPPLQAADLLANETFHYWLDTIATSGAPLRDAIGIHVGNARF